MKIVFKKIVSLSLSYYRQRSMLSQWYNDVRINQNNQQQSQVDPLEMKTSTNQLNYENKLFRLTHFC